MDAKSMGGGNDHRRVSILLYQGVGVGVSEYSVGCWDVM